MKLTDEQIEAIKLAFCKKMDEGYVEYGLSYIDDSFDAVFGCFIDALKVIEL